MMTDHDSSFLPNRGLYRALDSLWEPPGDPRDLPDSLPEKGMGEIEALELLSAHVFGKAARLDATASLAHMDPPTPWVTWATAMWNARLNQNLLHKATSPFAAEAEGLVLGWLNPYFGMQGGHFCAGSSIANLTAIWAARDSVGVRRIVTSESAHVSIEKAARILGLHIEKLPVNGRDQIDSKAVGRLDDACLVLTAGTTATGAIDPLELVGQAKWTHVDAAWAGPLRLSPKHSDLLSGIDKADSVAVSAHKWLFQPKDAAVVLFKDVESANAAIGFGGAYLDSANIGVQGSRGAAAVSLLATLLAWGRDGIAQRLEHAMFLAMRLASMIDSDSNLTLWAEPTTGVTVFRPANTTIEDFMTGIPKGMFSTCVLSGESWLRSVSANPMADIDDICNTVREASRR